MFRTILFCAFIAMSAFFQIAVADAAKSPEDTPQLTASPEKLEVVEGNTAQVIVKLGDNAVDKWDDYKVELKSPSDCKAARTETKEGGVLYFQAPVFIPENWNSAAFTITIKKSADTNAKDLKIEISVVHETKTDWEARAIIGWHQAGASSAESSQHLFFDFFVARPFGRGPVYNSSMNLWGQVRVASSPQQKNIPISQFAIDFTSQLGEVKVNELAQSAEFLTGFEIRPFCKGLLNRNPEDKDHWYDICRSGPDSVRTLGIVGFFGANGAFSDPVTTGHVFRVPDSGSLQWPNFLKQFPSFNDPAFAANSKYIGLAPADRDRFFREYGAGIRYTSYNRKNPGNAPAMYTATIGQDQSVTSGRYIRPVLKFDAFYPLPFTLWGGPSFIYLFGTANLAVTKPKQETPLALELVSAPCKNDAPAGDSGNKCDVKLYQSNVAVFAVPSSRDTYRIGVGIDFLGFLKSLPTSK
jgi:hypothetical protein